MIDGLLRQAQDIVRCVQTETKEVKDKLQTETKEIKDKLIKVDTVLDGIAAACKQLSLDIHVAKTKQEQRMDGFVADFKQHVGHTKNGLNSLGPVVPSMKTALDHLQNTVDYLATAYKANERVEPVVHNLQEQTNNIEDRLVRLESLVMGVTDTCNDNSEMCQQLKEAVNLLHDHTNMVLERLPKLPKRTPPSQDQPSSTSTAPTQPQVQTQSTTVPTIGPTVDAGIPLRLSEHLMPVQRAQEPIRFELRPSSSSSQLQHVPTDELLRCLLSRQNFS